VNNSSLDINSSSIIQTLFPGSVTGKIIPIDDHQSYLNIDEASIIASASIKRKLEFSSGRYCAKKLLEQYNHTNISILPGQNREPVWPDGIIGSISHCKDLCGAVINKRTEIHSIGFDIENIKQTRNDIGRIVCTPEEKQWIKQQNQYPYNILVLLIFSLKESVYKCIYQYKQIKIGFKDCIVIPDFSTNTAKLHFQKQDMQIDLHLTFAINSHHIYSGAICY
jgi:4'-phosphopantetheinyl transferase EntD